MIPNRTYDQDQGVDTRRPNPPRGAGYDEATGELYWSPPAGAIPFSHFNLYADTEAQFPSHRLSAGTARQFLPTPGMVRITAYNAVSRTESAPIYFEILKGWAGAAKPADPGHIQWAPDQDYPDSLAEFDARLKGGERPSLLDFIPAQYRQAIRDGSITTDLTGWIQDGLDSVAQVGGGYIWAPFGLYPVKDITLPGFVSLKGDGMGKTRFKRNAVLPSGRGLFNLASSFSALEELSIDGQVTVSDKLAYSTLGDPMAANLTDNSSIWIAGGATDIDLRRVRIFHTGGRAVIADARSAPINRVKIKGCLLENNRPHLFGPTVAEAIYGSWTGGIHMQGNGTANAVHDLHIDKCTFRRGTGNQVHGHVYGFGVLHSDIKVTDCSFTDIGRDGVLVGGATGGVVSGNSFRRIGYICSDDTSPAVPRWISNQWAVALDTAGLVRGVNYVNNTFLNCLGAAMDGDGLADCSVSGNTARVSLPSESEYTEDNVAAWPANYCYGFQTSNTSSLVAASRGVNVTGNTFINLGLGAIRLFAARKCSAHGNIIWSPDVPLSPPISIGNISNLVNDRGYDNAVYDNTIHYNPPSPAPAIYEDASQGAFAATDRNWVSGNRIFGALGLAYEFEKDPNTASVTGVMFSSQKGGLTAKSTNFLQREDGYLRMYGGLDTLFTLYDRHTVTDIGAGTSGGPLFNVSLNAVGGAITTGGRTVLAVDDVMATGLMSVDSFLALNNTTFSDPKADLFPDAFGLIRYDSTAKIFQISTAGGAGAGPRVWVDLVGGGGGSGSPAPPLQSVQFNGSGLFAGSADLTWDNSLKLLSVTGAGSGTPAVYVSNGYVEAAIGFLSMDTVPTTVNIPLGGITAKVLISIRNDEGGGLVLGRTESTDPGTGLPTGVLTGDYRFRIDAGNNLLLRDQIAVADRMKLQTDGLVLFGDGIFIAGGPYVAIDQNGDLTASNRITADTLLSVNPSKAYNVIQALTGGVYVGRGFTADHGLYLKSYGAITTDGLGNVIPDKPDAAYGGLAHKVGMEYWIWNGTAWTAVNLGSIGAVPGGVTGSVQYNNAGALAGNSVFVWNIASQRLDVTGISGNPAINAITGFIQSDQGFLTLRDGVDADTAIHAPFGGVTAKSLIAIRDDGASAITIARGSAVAARYGLKIDSSGNLVLADETASPVARMYMTSAGVFGFGSSVQIDQAGDLTASGAVVALSVQATGALPNQIHATAGGIRAFRALTSDQALYLKPYPTLTGLEAPGGGFGGISYLGGTQYRIYNPNVPAWITVDFAAIGGVVPGGVDRSVQFNNAGVFGGAGDFTYSAAKTLSLTGNLLIAGAANVLQLLVRGVSGQTATLQEWQLADGTAKAAVDWQGNIVAPVFAARYMPPLPDLTSRTTELVMTGRQIRFAQDAGDHNSAGLIGYRSFGLAALSIVGAGPTGNTRVVNLYDIVNIAGTPNNAGLTVSNGWVLSGAGFVTAVNSYQAFSAMDSGGVAIGGFFGRSGHFVKYIHISGEFGPPTPTGAPGSPANGWIFYNKTSDKFQGFEGGVWKDFIGGAAAGVSSITGRANQITATPSTGIVSLTLPQDIALTSNVQFQRLGLGVATTAIPLHVFGHSGREIARFQPEVGQSDNRSFISLYLSNADFWWEFSAEDFNGGASINGLAIWESSAGVRNRRLYFSREGAVIVGPTFSPSRGLFQVHGNLGVASSVNNSAIVAAFAGTGGKGSVLELTYNAGTSSGNTRGIYWGNDACDFGIIRYNANGAAAQSYDFYIAENGRACFNTTAPSGSGAQLTVSGFIDATTGFYSANASDQIVNVPNGGVWANKLTSNYGFFCKSYPGATQPPVSIGSTYSGLIHNTGTSWWMWSGTQWISVDLAAGVGGAGLPGAPSTSVQFNNTGAFGGDPLFTWNNTQKGLQVGGGSYADARLQVTGITYFGDAADYMAFYRLAEDNLAIQTVLNGNSIGGTPGFGGDASILRLQPVAGRVVIGPVDHTGNRLSVHGNIEFWNTANVTGLRYVGFAGQTANHAQWETSAGVPKVAIDPGFSVIAEGFGAKLMAAVGGSDTVAGKYMGREIRFAHTASPVEQGDAGIISYNQLNAGALSLVGYGVSGSDRLIRLFDHVILSGTLKVGGGLSAATLVLDSTSTDQLYIGRLTPQITLGNTPSFATATQQVRLAMATTGGDFGLPLAGDGYLYTFGNGAAAGALVLGVFPYQTVRITPGHILVTGSTPAGPAMTVNTGWIATNSGLNCTAVNFDSIQSTGGFKGNIYTLTGRGDNPGNPAAGNAAIYCNGAQLLATVGAGTYVNLLAPPLPSDPTFNSLTVTTTIAAGGVIASAVSNATLAFQAGGGKFSVFGNGFISGDGEVNFNGAFKQATFTFYGTDRIFRGSGADLTGNIVTTGAIQSTITGATPAIQAGGGAFAAYGNGDINGRNINAGGQLQVAGTTIVDTAHNFINVLSLTASGAIQTTVAGTAVAFQANGGAFQAWSNGDINGRSINAASQMQVAGTTFIDFNHNMINIRDITSIGNITVSGSVNASGLTSSGGVGALAFNPKVGGTQYFGLNSADIVIPGMTVGGSARTTIQVRGGAITNVF